MGRVYAAGCGHGPPGGGTLTDAMATVSYPRAARLSGSRQFDAVFREGRRYAGGRLAIRVRRNGLAITRFGLAVRRGAAGAVGRNRTKRRLREAFRLERAALPVGLDVVAQPTRDTDAATIDELRADLARLCAKADSDARLPAPPAPR